MQQKVIVSVIINYNEDRGWLNEAIESVYKNKETIPEWVEIELIRVHRKNSNASQNLNNGIKIATGEFIKYLSEDDRLTSNCIVNSLEAFKPETDFIHGRAWNFYQSNGRGNVYVPKYKFPTLDQLVQPNWHIHGGTLMYRKRVFEKVGYFNTKLTCAEELEFNLRCLKAGLIIGYSDEVLYEYRRHENQKSLGSNVDQKAREIMKEQIRNKFKSC